MLTIFLANLAFLLANWTVASESSTGFASYQAYLDLKTSRKDLSKKKMRRKKSIALRTP